MGFLVDTLQCGRAAGLPRRKVGMRAGVHATPGRSSLSVEAGSRALWYVPDRRIRTQAAAQHATKIAEWASTGGGAAAEPDEFTLFIALHICAYRSARCDSDQAIAAIEREEWSRRWRDIRECIVQKNMGLVYLMLGRVRSCDPDEDDRLSEAMFGLARAVERFNPWKGYRFSTYACNAIVRSLVRRDRRQRRYRDFFPIQRDLLIERPLQLGDSRAELYAERLNRAMSANLAELTELETRIIAERFPQNRKDRLTLQKVADGVGLSKERIRQIQTLALEKLRLILEIDPVLQ